MRLLLVEDDPNLSRSLAAQLEQAGYPVEKSTDGAKVSITRANTPSISRSSISACRACRASS